MVEMTDFFEFFGSMRAINVYICNFGAKNNKNHSNQRIFFDMRRLMVYMASLLLFFMSGGHQAHAQYDKDVFSFRGRQALADGKYAQAIENFNVLLQLDKSDYWTYFFRGIAKYNLGDLRGAKADFDKSVHINPVFTSGYHYLGITESRFGNYDVALGNLQKAIDLRPGSEGLYFSRGVTYFLSQQFELAVDDFDRYIRKQPKDPSAFLNRGASHLFLGDTLQAFNDYNKAIKLDRFDPEGYIRRGRLFAEQNDYEQAIADMDRAIELDTLNTFAYFNRAIMHYERQDYRKAMADLNKVLEEEPGNALTLYNRGLIHAQLGAYEDALSDLDRVLNINPENVLAYFNRASIFIEMGLYENAVEDYDMAIELYPDFAKAYMNRSYVKGLLGDMKASKKDYDTAQRKVREYRAKNIENAGSFADTTKKYSSLLSLDAEFAKKDFNDELLQNRDINVRLRPLYRFELADRRDDTNYALAYGYENPLLVRFLTQLPVPVVISNDAVPVGDAVLSRAEAVAWNGDSQQAFFLRALCESAQKQFNSSLSSYGKAIERNESDAAGRGLVQFDDYYAALYYLNRGVLRADMIEFIASIESNVQVLSMDDSGNTRARVKDQVSRSYDYNDAIQDMLAAAEIIPDLPYVYFNLGNLYCLSKDHVKSIENYTKAIELYSYMGDAYFNRGLVLIYLKDKEKGCIDLSRAGELGVQDAYGVIKKYCEDKNE